MTYGLTAVEFILDLGPRARADEARLPAPRVHSAPWASLARMRQRVRAFFATSPYEPVEPDLIDHPAFQGMSLRELADLPFPRYALPDAAPSSEDPASAPKSL